MKYIKDRLSENIRNYIVNNDLINEHLQIMFNQVKTITLDPVFKNRHYRLGNSYFELLYDYM